MDTVSVYLTTGEARAAIWCDVCLLPSIIECDLFSLIERGDQVSVGRFGVYRQCQECGGR